MVLHFGFYNLPDRMTQCGVFQKKKSWLYGYCDLLKLAMYILALKQLHSRISVFMKLLHGLRIECGNSDRSLKEVGKVVWK